MAEEAWKSAGKGEKRHGAGQPAYAVDDVPDEGDDYTDRYADHESQVRKGVRAGGDVLSQVHVNSLSGKSGAKRRRKQFGPARDRREILRAALPRRVMVAAGGRNGQVALLRWA